MRKFFAILLCLVVGTSALARTRQPKTAHVKPTGVITTAVRLLVAWRFGVFPASDGLKPPIPPPGARTVCCK